METVKSVRQLIMAKDWAGSIDLTDAYLHVTIHPISRKYLQFVFELQVFQFTALPFGMSLSLWIFTQLMNVTAEKVREKSKKCHNHKSQPFPDPKRKRKPTNLNRKLTNLNKHKPNKRTKSTKISSLFPKRGNRNTKRTEKHKNKMTHGKTYNKSPRRINHKATKSKTNTGTTALERSAEQTTGGFKALLQLANFTLGPDATLYRNT